MAEISITFKEGPGYDAPWVVIKAGSVDEASALLKDLRDKHVFSGVKAAAVEFKAAPVKAGMPPDSQQQAESTVQKVIPGSEVKSRYPNHGYGTGIQGDQQLPDSVTPHCTECQQAAQHKQGVSRQGTTYSGWYCLNKNCEKYWKPVK